MAMRGPASVLDRREGDSTTHVVRDRLTRHRSPARAQKILSYGNDCNTNEDDVFSADVQQPYRTSFSAVVTPSRSKFDRSRSTSPGASSLKSSNRSRSKSPGGRRSHKHVTYDNKVVIRKTGTKDSITNLSDRDSDKGYEKDLNDTSGHFSANSSILSSDMSNSSQPDYSSQLRELSQQIVREYSTSSETENETGNHKTAVPSQNKNRNYRMSNTPNGTRDPVYDTDSRKPRDVRQQNGGNREMKKIIIKDDYEHDRTISYRAAIKENYSDDIKRQADDIMETVPQKDDTESKQGKKSESLERRNSLPLDTTKNYSEGSSKLTPSKRSISSSIGNFFRRLSPHMGRRSKKGNLSNASSQSLSPGDDLDGSFDKHASTTSLSRGKFRRSLRKLFGKSKKENKSLNKTDSSLEDLNRSQQNTTEDDSKQTPKSSLYMKSIEQSSKSDKDVYHKFKERQTPTRSGEINAAGKPQAMKVSRVPSPESETNDRINSSLSEEEFSTSARAQPPDSLDVRCVPKSIKSLQASTYSTISGDDSIGECSIDPNLTGSEPSLLSHTSTSKQVAVSQISEDAVIPENQSPTHSSPPQSAKLRSVQDYRITDKYNRENKPPNDLDVSYPQMPIISDSVEFIPKEIVRTPSYLRIASAVSGYGHYSRYSAYKGIEKRSPYSSTLSLRSSRSDLATPLSPVDMPIGKIPNIQPPTNYPPIRTNVLSPKNENTVILESPSVNGANEIHSEVNGEVNGDISVNGEISNGVVNGENGHSTLVENFVTTGDCLKDGEYFLGVAQEEETKLVLLCSKCEMELAGGTISEEVCGKIRSAVGKANLLINQKFRQFQELCRNHMNPDLGSKPTKWEDLQGFWEMVKLQVDDVDEMFTELELMKQNGWREIKTQSRRSSASSRSSPKSGSLSVSNTSTPSHTPGSKRRANKLKDTPESSPERTQKAKMAAKVREDNRKKLLAEKRAAMKQQKIQNENVEIYVADSSSKSNSSSRNSVERSDV